MIDKLKRDIIQFLEQHETGHLALSSPSGPWACVVRVISVDLTLYLIEPMASDLVFYVENDPQVVLTIDDPGPEAEGGRRQSVQVFGSARVLQPQHLDESPDCVQVAYSSENRQAPGVYVVIEVKPWRIYRVVQDEGGARRDTLDIDISEMKS